jgi:hypothetical protein
MIINLHLVIKTLTSYPMIIIIYIKVVMWPTIGLKILETKKLMRLQETVLSPWVTASVQLSTLKDHLYFKMLPLSCNNCAAQYGKTTMYLSN